MKMLRYLMVSLLTVLLLPGVLSVASAQQKAFSVRGTTWGSSVEEVKENEQQRDSEDWGGKTDDKRTVLRYSEEQVGEIQYHFMEGNLFMIILN